MIIEKQKMIELLNIIKNNLMDENDNLKEEDFLLNHKILANILEIKFPIFKLYGFLISFWILNNKVVNFREKLDYYLHRYNIEENIIDLHNVIIIKKKKSIKNDKKKEKFQEDSDKVKIKKNSIIMLKTIDCPDELSENDIHIEIEKNLSKNFSKKNLELENFDNYFRKENKKKIEKTSDRNIIKKRKKNINLINKYEFNQNSITNGFKKKKSESFLKIKIVKNKQIKSENEFNKDLNSENLTKKTKNKKLLETQKKKKR